MNLIERFQDLIAQVPELVQPLIVAAAGAVPFIEGEGAATIGILGGIHPVIAAAAGAIGNFLCVAALVLLGSGTRTAVIARRDTRTRSRERVLAGGHSESDAAASTPAEATSAPASPRAVKFQRAFERYGLPGVSLLGPLLLPTQFTATMLAAAGVGKVRILVWQAIAIIIWTTAITVVISGAVSAAQ